MIQINDKRKLSDLNQQKFSKVQHNVKLVREMQKAVIIYSTTDGQTKRICEFLIQKLKAKIYRFVLNRRH